jgi:hypothetical protein
VKRVVLGILGAVLGLLGLGLLGGGLLLLTVFGTDGKATVPIGTLSAQQGRAVVVTDFQISSSTPLPVDQSWFDLQLEVTGGQSHFVGVAPKADSLRYLQGASYELVTGFDSSNGMIDALTIPGDARPADPAAQTFWADQQAGTDVVVDWPVVGTDTTLVVMNEDVGRGVDADVTVLLTISWAGAVGVGTAVAGLVLMIVAIVVLVLAFRRGPTDRAPAWSGAQGV